MQTILNYFLGKPNKPDPTIANLHKGAPEKRNEREKAINDKFKYDPIDSKPITLFHFITIK